MKTTLHWLGLAALLTLLTACGFHLRGLGGAARPLPFQNLYLDAHNTALGQDLLTVLKRNPNLTLASDAKSAAAVLSVLSEGQSKDVLTINAGGKINEYQLTYVATVRAVIGGVPVTPDMVATVRRTLNYSDSAVLGKEQEETLLWADARRDAAEQIVRRLAYLKPPAAASAPQSETPNAVPQH